MDPLMILRAQILRQSAGASEPSIIFKQENQIFTNPNGPVNNSFQLNSIKGNICSNTKKTKYKSQLYQSPSPQVSIFKQENYQTHI